MLRTSLRSSTSPLSFAHLASVVGLGPKAGKVRAEDEDPDKGKDPNAADDDEKDPDDDKAKKAKADEDDDENCDDEEEMRGKGALAQARRRERSRCASILGSPHAAGNVILAANLAFNSSMTRKEAIAVLKDTPKAEGAGAGAGREARNPTLGPGGERTSGSPAASEVRWDRAFAKVKRAPSK